MGDLWRSLGGLWEVSGRFLGGLQEVSVRSLADLLGEGPPVDSKSVASLSENAKMFPRLPTLPCVFEDQNHFML